MAADLVESGLRAVLWVEGPEPSPVRWFEGPEPSPVLWFEGPEPSPVLWVEGPEPSPVLWFDVESPVAGSAFATPAAPTMVAKAPRVNAPAASHAGASL